MGAVAFVLVIAVLIFYFLGVKVFLWCVLLGIAGTIFAYVRIILKVSGKISQFNKSMKWLWKRYEKLEERFFKWLDHI